MMFLAFFGFHFVDVKTAGDLSSFARPQTELGHAAKQETLVKLNNNSKSTWNNEFAISCPHKCICSDGMVNCSR